MPGGVVAGMASDQVTVTVSLPSPVLVAALNSLVAVGADASEEDCLRRRLIIGRESGVTDPAPPVTAIVPPRLPLGAGEMIDVRAETVDAAGRRSALWRRVRFTGKPERPWLTHDWRELRLPRADIECPLAAPDAKITPDLDLRGNAIPP